MPSLGGFFVVFRFFFFNDTATTEIYTLSLHDALPIFSWYQLYLGVTPIWAIVVVPYFVVLPHAIDRSPEQSTPVVHRSEEHTSELQSQSNLVCRLLLEKKKQPYSSCIEQYMMRAIGCG